MLRSMDVAKVNPSNSWSTSLILGIGQGVQTILLLTSLKPVKKRTWPSFFVIINAGEPHSDWGCGFSTPNSTKRSTSFLKTAFSVCGIGKTLPWYGLAPRFKSNLTGSVWKSPSVPLNSSLYFCDKFSNFACSEELKWLQFSQITFGRSAFS